MNTVSSLEIAKITGVPHTDVFVKIWIDLARSGVNCQKFTMLNNDVFWFGLPRNESDLVMSCYSIESQLAVLDLWYKMDSENMTLAASVKIEDPQKEIAFLRRELETAKKVIAWQAQNTINPQP